MGEVEETSNVAGTQPLHLSTLDAEQRSYLIGCAKIRELELRLEEYFADLQERIGAIRQLQQLKAHVIASGDQGATGSDRELAQLLESARAAGLNWSKEGWDNRQDKQSLIDAIQMTISGKESENQTQFMRINRLMNLRSETTSLFSKTSQEMQSEKLRILGRIDRR